MWQSSPLWVQISVSFRSRSYSFKVSPFPTPATKRYAFRGQRGDRRSERVARFLPAFSLFLRLSPACRECHMCANCVHAPVRRGTAGHPWLPVGTSGTTVSGAGAPSGSGISLENVVQCRHSVAFKNDCVQRHLQMMSFDTITEFLYLVTSMRHADRAMKIRTPLEVGLVIRERRRELNLTPGRARLQNRRRAAMDLGR